MATLNIVGAGHVARALGRCFAQAGVFEVQDVLARSAARAREAVDFIGAGAACAEPSELRSADVWMLAVSDDAIATVSAQLAPVMRGAVVFHCSGAKASSELAADGAALASVHPVRSFADPAAVAAQFAGTLCGIEGDAAALAVLEPAFQRIGARPVRIDAASKTLYHAASVFASNYLVTVLDAALRAYEAAGIAPGVARELAAPLASETLANVLRMGGPAALSGPIARGDETTVARQFAAVSAWDAATGSLYAALADATRPVAQRKKRN
ncbi:MAG: Rossmann-like and DUF2520 domain-containing protein [Telluria sp.]